MGKDVYQLRSSLKIRSVILMSSVGIISHEECILSSMSLSINSSLKRLFSHRAFGVLVKAFEPCYRVVILVFQYKIFKGRHHFLFPDSTGCLVLPLINVWVSVMAPQISLSRTSCGTRSRYRSRCLSKAQFAVRSWATSLHPRSSSASEERRA